MTTAHDAALSQPAEIYSSQPSADARVRFWMAPHTYACATSDGVVILDARRNKYVGIDTTSARQLAFVVAGWPISPLDNPTERFDANVAMSCATDLAKTGLIADSPFRIKRPSSPPLTRNQTLYAVGFGSERSFPLRLHHVLRFTCAYVNARWSLRFRPFDAVIRSIELRKGKALEGHATPGAHDLENIRELVSVFRRIRHWVFTGRGQCLMHALTLVDFLARYGVSSTWVIGVSTTPWAAHSWVEYERYVLDGTPEKILYYTPIFRV